MAGGAAKPALREVRPYGRDVRLCGGIQESDLSAVKRAVGALMTDSQDWCPADSEH
jgi:catalase (peroxidase I)